MVGYLGIPSLEYLRRSEATKNVFDEQGQCAFELYPASSHFDRSSGHWKGRGGVNVPDTSLEQAEIILNGEEKKRFLNFVRSMLRWLPEERRRAVDLLTDPWLEGAIPGMQTT